MSLFKWSGHLKRMKFKEFEIRSSRRQVVSPALLGFPQSPQVKLAQFSKHHLFSFLIKLPRFSLPMTRERVREGISLSSGKKGVWTPFYSLMEEDDYETNLSGHVSSLFLHFHAPSLIVSIQEFRETFTPGAQVIPVKFKYPCRLTLLAHLFKNCLASFCQCGPWSS